MDYFEDGFNEIIGEINNVNVENFINYILIIIG